MRCCSTTSCEEPEDCERRVGECWWGGIQRRWFALRPFVRSNISTAAEGLESCFIKASKAGEAGNPLGEWVWIGEDSCVNVSNTSFSARLCVSGVDTGDAARGGVLNRDRPAISPEIMLVYGADQVDGDEIPLEKKLESVFGELWRLWRSILLIRAISAFRMGFIGQMCSCLTWVSRVSMLGKEAGHQSQRHEMTLEAMVETNLSRSSNSLFVLVRFSGHGRAP